MNRDDIIRMAMEIGGVDRPLQGSSALKFMEEFAALVAAAEREACAKVCDALPFLNGTQCATAIRMRGEK